MTTNFMEKQNTNGENKIRKILFNEISFVIAIIGFVLGIVFWVANPQKELELQLIKVQTQLENNQTVTAALDKIKANDLNEIQIRLKNIEDRQIEILQAITRLETKLEK
jgi:hypothetical protein